MMPIVGWFLGRNLVGFARQWGPWLAFALLFFIGARMSYESLRGTDPDEEGSCADPTRGLNLVVLSVATSLDALGVGFSLGMLGQDLLFAATWIGITACTMTWMAMKLGNRLSVRFGQRMETIGGVLLMAISVKLLV